MVAAHDVMAAGYIDTVEKAMPAFDGMGAIDLRVDSLRPAFGEEFIGTGHALRVGRRVTVTRMELHGGDGELAAVGTAAYRIDAG